MKYLRKLDTLQRELLIWMVMFGLCFCMGIYYINHVPNDHEGIIRLHVIANSDSKIDQAVKLKVRDEIIRSMEGKNDIAEARQYIESHLDDITKEAEITTKKEGMNYGARAELGNFFIPKKSYEDLTLPAGNYEALRVVLGEGKGQNWWCVIFPQLCLIGEEKNDEPDVFSEKIVLKSKIKELLKKESRKEG